jgi:hypothetical protein
MKSLLSFSKQVLIEPATKEFEALDHARPAMSLPFSNDQFERRIDFSTLSLKPIRLLDWHQFIGITMDHQRERHLRCNEVDQ